MRLISVVCLLSLMVVSQAQSSLRMAVEPALQPALTALYAAYAEGEAPSFVDAAADIAVITGTDGSADYILPDVALVAESDAGVDFVEFAVSVDGQQVLVDGGFLPDEIVITDQSGREVTIAQPVRRVMSPYSLGTYHVYGVGGQDRLVAAGYLGANNPQTAAFLEAVDPRFPELNSYGLRQDNVNIEQVVLLEPDVILSSVRAEWVDAVEALGIPVVIYEGETPERLMEAVQLTGTILGPNTQAQAYAWVDYYQKVIATVAGQTPEDRPNVLFTGTEALRVASGEMYQTAMIELAGGNSVTTDLSGYWNDVNLEQVVLWEPDVIFVPPYGGASVEAITDSEEWQVLAAVQAGDVFRVPRLGAPWDTPVPDSVLGIIWMADRLYPDVMLLECVEETRFFFETFYDYAVSDEEIAGVCGD